MSVPSRPFAARWGRWAVLAAIGFTVAAAIATPPAPPVPDAGRLVRGDIQHFRLLENPRPVPEETFRDADGRNLGLDRFRGKVVLLNFWATWCLPCRREMPALDRLQAKYGGPDFEVIALSIDREGLEKVTPFYAEIGLENLRIYLDPPGRLQRAFGIARLPTTVLIDREGREVGRLEGPAEWMAPEAQALIRHFIEALAQAPASPR